MGGTIGPSRLLLAAGAVAIFGASPAHAFQSESSAEIEALKTGIADGCHPDAQGRGVIGASDLRKALVKAFPIVWDWTGDAPPSNAAMVLLIQNAGLSPGDTPAGPNRASFQKVGGVVRGWTMPGSGYDLPIDQGGVRVERRSGGPVVADDLQRLLRAIFLNEDASQFVFVCANPTPTPPPAEPGVLKVPPPRVTIAKAPDQLGKGGADQKPGEIGLIDDRKAGTTKFATNIAVGVAIPIFRPTRADPNKQVSIGDASIIPFVSYVRQGSSDPSEKSYVNNLSFGLATNGFIDFSGSPERGTQSTSIYYSLSGRYETDDKFHSDAWFLDAHLQPILPVPGNTAPYFPVSSKSLELGFMWSFAGALDHSSVSDPWLKQGLIGTPHFTRLGTDVTGALILRPAWGYGQWSFRLEATHYDRWDLDRFGGSAHLFSSKFSFAPTDSYSFSLGYDRGRVLDSLEQIHQWKLTIDLKR